LDKPRQAEWFWYGSLTTTLLQRGMTLVIALMLYCFVDWREKPHPNPSPRERGFDRETSFQALCGVWYRSLTPTPLLWRGALTFIVLLVVGEAPPQPFFEGEGL
jgi:hypothetical protein